jgi:hydrogenase nickel incorporation protein HypA/HybF
VHEYSIATGLVRTAAEHARAQRVTGLRVRVGALRQVVPEALEFAFELAARGTPCEGAAIEFELVPCRLRCAACEREWTASEPIFRCVTCGDAAVVLGGEELQLEWIEVEDKVCHA